MDLKYFGQRVSLGGASVVADIGSQTWERILSLQWVYPLCKLGVRFLTCVSFSFFLL